MAKLEMVKLTINEVNMAKLINCEIFDGKTNHG